MSYKTQIEDSETVVKKMHLVATDQERASRSDAIKILDNYKPRQGMQLRHFVTAKEYGRARSELDGPHRLAYVINIPQAPKNASVFRGFYFAQMDQKNLCQHFRDLKPKRLL